MNKKSSVQFVRPGKGNGGRNFNSHDQCIENAFYPLATCQMCLPQDGIFSRDEGMHGQLYKREDDSSASRS